MAEWIRDTDKLDYHRLNQLSFQAFLWLPQDLARDVSNTLANKPGADSVRTIIQKVRKHLLDKKDDLDPNLINVFKK